MNKIINIMNEHNIGYNWNTLYFAYCLNIMTMEDVENFALDYLNCDVISNEINEIICGVNGLELQKLLKTIANKTVCICNEQLEKRRLRLALLIYAEQKYEGKALLKKIEEVYSMFDYPAEMEMLIYYMPYEKNDNYLSGTERIMNDFKMFIASEKGALFKSI